MLERKGGLLFYPSQYEGGETSRHIVCTGSTPQQQAWPAVDFLIGIGRRRFVLVGHPSIYSRGTHDAIAAYAPTVRATIVADLAIADTDANWSRVVAAILAAEAPGALAVISTLSGDASVPFFREMARQGIHAERIPTLSLSIGESEMPALDGARVAGNYVAWSYLFGIEAETNRSFVEKWRRICGDPAARTSDSLEATYIGFSLWRQAVEKAGSTAPADVWSALHGMSIDSPNGFRVSVTANRHITRPAFVGQIRNDSTITPVWATGGTLMPDGKSTSIRAAA